MVSKGQCCSVPAGDRCALLHWMIQGCWEHLCYVQHFFPSHLCQGFPRAICWEQGRHSAQDSQQAICNPMHSLGSLPSCHSSSKAAQSPKGARAMSPLTNTHLSLSGLSLSPLKITRVTSSGGVVRTKQSKICAWPGVRQRRCVESGGCSVQSPHVR